MDGQVRKGGVAMHAITHAFGKVSQNIGGTVYPTQSRVRVLFTRFENRSILSYVRRNYFKKISDLRN